MSETLLHFTTEPNCTAQIKVLGVGGGGGNAVNYMYNKGIAGVGFVVCNTDSQALINSPVPVTVQLGNEITQGRGAGNMPELGRQAAEESVDQLNALLENTTDMVFITAGMGGGTGTGAAPVIADLCKKLNILTIAVVTVPSKSEGPKRYDQAIEGVNEIKQHVDSLLVINNDKIREIYGNLPASQAFAKADEIVATAVKGVAEIITLHGSINIDFADVSTVMTGSEVFIMGIGTASGENRAHLAVDNALESPLLDSNDIFGTKDILLNITSGANEITIGEIGEIIEYLQDKAGDDANIIWGNGFDKSLTDEVCVTIIATGFKTNPSELLQENQEKHEIEFEIQQQEIFISDELKEGDVNEKIAQADDEKIKAKTTIKKETKRKKKKNETWLKRQLDLFFEENSSELE
jgi:cell division protein FtsZ